MRAALTSFFERHGLKMERRCSRSFLVWLLSVLAVPALLVLLLLTLNPQTNRFVFIFQSMFTSRGGSHPWGDDGPKPPKHYTGVWYRWHWNGRLSFEEHYADGKLDGAFIAWDRSGSKWLGTAYRAGRYHGDYILFYKTGATNKVRHYDNEKPIGRWLHFYEDGKLWEERFFSAPGVPDGEEVVWNTNGVVSFRHTWRKGEPWDGRFTLHKGTNWFRDQYESGTLVSSTNLGPFPPGRMFPHYGRLRNHLHNS